MDIPTEIPTRRYVLVTTKHRGVFAGYLADQADTTVILDDCRNAIRWGTTEGFLELAAKGPGKSSKIGAKAPRVTLHDVTSVSDCSDEAREAWERA